MDLETKDKNSVVDIDLKGLSAYDIGKLLVYWIGVNNVIELDFETRTSLTKYANKSTAEAAYSEQHKEFSSIYFLKRKKTVGSRIIKQFTDIVFNRYLNMSILQRRAMLAGIVIMLRIDDKVLIEKNLPDFKEFFVKLVESLGGIISINFEDDKHSKYLEIKYTFKKGENDE